MAGSDQTSDKSADIKWRDVPIDWEALEDAFENNAPEVHSYLHVPTGDVLRIVDGVADPQMHARIAADPNYLRIEPVSSREQYRWMERYIPMVEDPELQAKLTRAIDGKGAFRRFKDVLMSYGPERERWFAFRSERLRIFMEAWLNAHALNPVRRPVWVPDLVEEEAPISGGQFTAGATEDGPAAMQESRETARRSRSPESLRRRLRDVIEALGRRDLESLAAFGDFLRTRHSSRPSQSSAPGATDSDDPDVGPDSAGSDSAAGDAASNDSASHGAPADASVKDAAPPTEKAKSGRNTNKSSDAAKGKTKSKDGPRSDKVPAKRASND